MALRPDAQETTREAASSAANSAATYVLMRIDDLHYAMPVEQVRRVLRTPRLTRVPHAGDHVIGVFQHEGQVLVAWDLTLIAQAGDPLPERPPALLCETPTGAVGLVVPAVVDVVKVQDVREEATLPDHVHPALASAVVCRLEADADEAERSAKQQASTNIGRMLQPQTGNALLRRVGVVHRLDLDRLMAILVTRAGAERPDAADDADGGHSMDGAGA